MLYDPAVIYAIVTSSHSISFLHRTFQNDISRATRGFSLALTLRRTYNHTRVYKTQVLLCQLANGLYYYDLMYNDERWEQCTYRIISVIYPTVYSSLHYYFIWLVTQSSRSVILSSNLFYCSHSRPLICIRLLLCKYYEKY